MRYTFQDWAEDYLDICTSLMNEEQLAIYKKSYFEFMEKTDEAKKSEKARKLLDRHFKERY